MSQEHLGTIHDNPKKSRRIQKYPEEATFTKSNQQVFRSIRKENVKKQAPLQEPPDPLKTSEIHKDLLFSGSLGYFWRVLRYHQGRVGWHFTTTPVLVFLPAWLFPSWDVPLKNPQNHTNLKIRQKSSASPPACR